MYQNYLFDLYGTLVDIKTDRWEDSLWEKMTELYGFAGAKYTAQELQKAYDEEIAREEERTKEKYPQFTYIEIELRNVFTALLTQKGINADENFADYTAKAFRAISRKHIRLYDGVLDLLSSLRKAEKKIYLLSNAQSCFTAPEIRLMDLEDKFDGIVLSSDEHTRKPDTAFYQIIFDRYNINLKESIMIGNDSIADIKGAYDAGLDSLYIHSNISPDIEDKLLSTYSIMDGDFTKVKDMILR